MLTPRHQDPDRSLRGFLARSLRVALALGLAVAPLLAFDAVGGRTPPPTTGGNDVAGDETVGTLPIVGPSSPFDLLRFLLDREASLYLEGNRFDVFSSIVSVDGRMVATLQMVDPATDTVRITFHGRPRLVLDRALVDAGALRFGVDVPTAFGAGQLQPFLGGRTFASHDLAAGPTELPLAPFQAPGLLLGRRLGFVIDGQGGAHTVLSFRATRRFLIVEQAH